MIEGPVLLQEVNNVIQALQRSYRTKSCGDRVRRCQRHAARRCSRARSGPSGECEVRSGNCAESNVRILSETCGTGSGTTDSYWTTCDCPSAEDRKGQRK